MTQQYHFVSMAALLSSTGISHHSLLPHIPSIRLSEANSSPRPGVAPQSLNSNSHLLPLPEDQCSCPECVWLCKDCLILIPFRLPQISCFTLSLRCFSSDSDSCRTVGIRPLLQFPHLTRAGPVLLTVLFFPLVPSSYRLSHGSIYSFPVVPSTLSWRSACTSVSEGVFLMYLWREKYSTFTYSSAILFFKSF